MHAADVPSERSPIAKLRRLFGRRDDPYAGADLVTARKLGGVLWMVSSVFALCLVALSPPTHSAIGGYGWLLGGAIFAGGLATGYALLKRGLRTTNEQLYAISFCALALTAAMEYLAGGRDTPWHSFYLLCVLFTAAIHPPRRVLIFLGAFLAAAATSAFHSGGWSHAETAEVGLETLLTLGIALLVIVVMDGVRAQRTTLAKEGDEARHLAHVDSLTGLGNRRAL